MRAHYGIITILLCSLLVGCVATSTTNRGAAPSWHLTPRLNPGTSLEVYVQDNRPAVELEKTPSTEYLYSGSLFAVSGNARTVGRALADLTVKFGGTQGGRVVNSLPKNGPAVVFELEHWYSRTLLKPAKAPIFVDGEFSGHVVSQFDGKPLAEGRISAKGTPVVVDTYIIFEREKRETPRLVWKAMERSANTSEQKGYAEIMNFLEANWHVFPSSP